METYKIIGIAGFILIIIFYIIGTYDIRYKGKCILHDWEYKFEYGAWWNYTGSFLRSNERWVCKKCRKMVKK